MRLRSRRFCVNRRIERLDETGQPIRGLFAAAEITGGFHGAAYMTASSLGKSSIFGRIAGRNVAAGTPA